MEPRTIIIRRELQHRNAMALVESITPNEDKPWCVRVEPYEPHKTDAQRNYWHKLLQMLGDHLGYTKGEMKSEIKRIVLGTTTYTGMDGREYEREASSEDEKRHGYSRLIDHTIRIAAENGLSIGEAA